MKPVQTVLAGVPNKAVAMRLCVLALCFIEIVRGVYLGIPFQG